MKILLGVVYIVCILSGMIFLFFIEDYWVAQIEDSKRYVTIEKKNFVQNNDWYCSVHRTFIDGSTTEEISRGVCTR